MSALQQVVTGLYARLEEAGVDFANPVPRLAWEVFKGFVSVPIGDGLRWGVVSLEFVHYPDRDEELWLSFDREIVFVGADGERVASTCVGCYFTRPVTEDLYSINKTVSSPGLPGLPEYFERAERHPAFLACMELSGWRWEEMRWNWGQDSDAGDDG